MVSAKLSAIEATDINSPITAKMELHGKSGAFQRLTLWFAHRSIEAHPIVDKICPTQRPSSHAIEQERHVTGTEAAGPRAGPPTLARAPVPSPYVRKITDQEMSHDAASAQHPLMQPIIWRRIAKTPKQRLSER